jgi:threonine dehydrogenase-like Zn-dependent dehydrogenase
MMKAAVWMNPWNIELRDVAKPVTTEPADAIVRITHNTICGSDLHLYAGELKDYTRQGMIMGHEAIGFVAEKGSDVKQVEIGDRVIILPIIACGKCSYCERKEFSLCDRTNPSKKMEGQYGYRISGSFGFSDTMGGFPGDQAEYCRVPNADLTCIKVPVHTDPKKLLGLVDVTTAAWHGCELAEVGKGDIVGVWGCGPVGLSIQRLAMIRGASKVYAVDKDPNRLKIAETYGMIPVDVVPHSNVSDYILSVQPHGLDCAIEASGFRSINTTKHLAMRTTGAETDSGDTVHAVFKSTRKGGHVALIGDFFYGTNDFPIGMVMQKGITIRGGYLPAQKVFRGIWRRWIFKVIMLIYACSIIPSSWNLSRPNMILHGCLLTMVSILYGLHSMHIER